MTMKAMAWANEISGVEMIDKLVLIGLAHRAGFNFDTGETIATATLDGLAEFCCAPPARVDEALGRLLRAGLIAYGHRRPDGQEYGLRVGATPREVTQ